VSPPRGDEPPLSEILGYVQGRRADLVDLCAGLVAARSDNPPGDTREVVEVVGSFLEAAGVSFEIIATDPVAPNLVATVVGAGSGPHLVMNAHADTIGPGDETQWTVPPFELTRKDGLDFGLGMGNMKGALAAMCFAIAWLAGSPSVFRGRVSLTVVSDEVVFGGRGAEALLAHRPDLLGDALLSGEGPGAMGLGIAEKGVGWFRVEATGAARQSMLVRGDDTPVAQLAKAIVEVDGMNRIEVEPPSELRDVAFDRDALRVSANVGVLDAGIVPNQVASTAAALIDLRIPPGLELSRIQELMSEAVAQVPGVSVHPLKGWDPSWTDPSEPIARCVFEAASAVRGEPPPLVVRLPGSDARRWRQMGVPAVCYGPQPSAVAGVDDYAAETDVADCAVVYALSALSLGERAQHA
jgi:succinyl-diaminopimelate desuccinylase